MSLVPTIKKIGARLWRDLRRFWWIPLGLLLYYAMARWLLPASCPFYQVLGLPCPGCGMTRAMRFVLTGQFARAYYMNPLVFVIILYALFCFFVRYVKGARMPWFGWGILVIFGLMVVLYLTRMYLWFPLRTPYVYGYGNFMEQRIPGYRESVLGFFRR